MKWMCDCSGQPAEVTLIVVDGYEIRERQLEGVKFLIDLTQTPPAVTWPEEDNAYLDDFRMDKIVKEMQEYVEDLDIAQCHKCGGEAWQDGVVFDDE